MGNYKLIHGVSFSANLYAVSSLWQILMHNITILSTYIAINGSCYVGCTIYAISARWLSVTKTCIYFYTFIPKLIKGRSSNLPIRIPHGLFRQTASPVNDHNSHMNIAVCSPTNGSKYRVEPETMHNNNTKYTIRTDRQLRSTEEHLLLRRPGVQHWLSSLVIEVPQHGHRIGSDLLQIAHTRKKKVPPLVYPYIPKGWRSRSRLDFFSPGPEGNVNEGSWSTDHWPEATLVEGIAGVVGKTASKRESRIWAWLVCKRHLRISSFIGK